MRARRFGLALMMMLGLPVPAGLAADDGGRSAAFVQAFAEACVPGRLTYTASLAAAEAAGWSKVTADAHAELAAIMAVSVAEAEEMASDPDFSDASFAYQAFAKTVDGRAHHLVMSRSSVVIGDPDETPNPWVYVGCHLYDLDATAPIDPEAVTAFVGKPISHSREQDGAVAHVWGPPCPLPRTGDTYLTFVSEAARVAELPFSGVALNFSTSELPEGEPVPDPYC